LPASLIALAAFTVAACVPVLPRAVAHPDGYLSPAQRPQVAQILAAAPTPGSARYAADRQIFTATRKLQGTPRWTLAEHDVQTALPDLMGSFSCAMGTPLDPATLPKLAHLLDRAEADGDAVNKPAKQANHRQRPFLIDDGAVCQSKVLIAHSFDYPSGHATRGWTAGLILAELAPDRATDLLLRARGYADSRVVCGAHNQSAIEAGALSAAATVAALHAAPAFQADLAAAKQELDAWRRQAPPLDVPTCAAERALITPTPY
jgi:acid phosphatase (class A)